MSTATTHAEATENHEVEHHGLSDRQYIVIALILAALTALANAASAGINMVLGADLAPDGARSEFLAAFRMMTSGGVVLAPLMITSLTALIALPAALAITGVLNFYGAYLFWKYLPIHAPDTKSVD